MKRYDHSERIGVLVRLPEELKPAIVAEVRRQGTNLNDVCVEILARHFGMTFNPTDRHCDRAGGKTLKVLLRLDRRLKRRLQVVALDRDTNLTDLVTRVLAIELGVVIDLPKPTRGSPFGGGPRKYRRSPGDES